MLIYIAFKALGNGFIDQKHLITQTTRITRQIFLPTDPL